MLHRVVCADGVYRYINPTHVMTVTDDADDGSSVRSCTVVFIDGEYDRIALSAWELVQELNTAEKA